MKRFLYVASALIIIGLVGITFTAACCPPPIEGNVQLTLLNKIDENDVEVYGATSLPDGAVLVACVTQESSNRSDERYAQVQNGQYSADFNLRDAGFVSGQVTAGVTFQPWRGMSPEQPESIYDTFGDKGQNMSGSLVHEVTINDSTFKQAQIEQTFLWERCG